jgi:NADH-quinone oxidoreductase subunit M
MGLWEASPTIALNIGGWSLTNYYGIIAIIGVVGIVVTAAYVLRVVQQVFFGAFNAERYGDIDDITVLDKVALLMLSASLIILGVWPQVMAPMIESGVKPIAQLLLGGA